MNHHQTGWWIYPVLEQQTDDVIYSSLFSAGIQPESGDCGNVVRVRINQSADRQTGREVKIKKTLMWVRARFRLVMTV